jgi:4-hydroxy-3-polyprenylbenzoate decarboxylase
LECLLASGQQVYLLLSGAARIVLKQECGLTLPNDRKGAEAMLRQHSGEGGELKLLGLDDWFSPVASGSNAPATMVVCPCSMGTLSAIAQGASDSLIERGADVVLKERRKLILVARETPLSEIHLENMLKLSRMGAVIMPASPGFYHRPASVPELVDFMVARVLDHLGLESDLVARWGDGE